MINVYIGSSLGLVDERLIDANQLNFPTWGKVELLDVGSDFDIHFDPRYISYLFRSDLPERQTEDLLGRYGTVTWVDDNYYVVVVSTTLLGENWMFGERFLPLPGETAELKKFASVLRAEGIRLVKYVKKAGDSVHTVCA